MGFYIKIIDYNGLFLPKKMILEPKSIDYCKFYWNITDYQF